MELRFSPAYCDGRAAADDEPIRFVASTEGVARDGMVIRSDAWQLDHFRSNAVIFYNHDYDRPPIGRATHVAVEDGRLVADIVFDRDDELGATIERKVRSGFMNAVSVGWQTLDMRDADADGKKLAAPEVTSADLWEISVVGVPSDTGATKQSSAAKAALVGARQAVAELTAALGDSDEEPEITVNVGGRVKSEAEIVQAIRNELLASNRKGAVLSRKNIEGLEAARDAIDAVLASAAKPEPEEEVITHAAPEADTREDDLFLEVLSHLTKEER